MKQVLVAYVPVIHQGYLNFFKKYQYRVQTLYLLDQKLIREFNPFKEIRALPPKNVQQLLAAFHLFSQVSLLSQKTLTDLKNVKIIAPNEQITRKFIQKHLSQNPVKYDHIFLRWDEASVTSSSPVKHHRVSSLPFDKAIIAQAKCESDKSSDWWRHVGAIVVKNKQILLQSHNQHVPSEHAPYVDGDPRDVIEAGTLAHLSTAIHAEQAVIAEAARKGVSLSGASIYLNVFPCPVCAKLIAFSGIKKCYFATGTAYLNVDQVLIARGVEIILVK